MSGLCACASPGSLGAGTGAETQRRGRASPDVLERVCDMVRRRRPRDLGGHCVHPGTDLLG